LHFRTHFSISFNPTTLVIIFINVLNFNLFNFPGKVDYATNQLYHPSLYQTKEENKKSRKSIGYVEE